MKSADELQIADFSESRVWQYTNSDRRGELAVRPVKRVPVKNLSNKLVGAQVVLANGAAVWAIIGNVDASNPRSTEHFLTLSIEREGKWFELARYHDVDFEKRGAAAVGEVPGAGGG